MVENAGSAPRARIPVVGWLAERPSLAGVGLLVLTVVFGMEVLRVMVPGVVWLLGDRLGLGALPAGGLTLLVFLSAFLAGPLRRALGDRLALVVTAGGLGLLRLVMQLWAGAPLVDFGLAMAGTALFIVFLPLFLRGAWQGGSVPIGYMALGLLAGLALDTAIHGAFFTYDMAWQSGLAPLLVTLFLVLAQWVLLAGFQPAEGAQGEAAAHGAASGVPWARSLTWVAIGPFLFLQLVVFQNIARLAALSGWALPWAFGWTLLSQLIGLAAAVWVLGRRWRTRWPLALACGLGLVVVLAIPYPQGAAATVVLAMLGQVLLSLSMVLVLLGIGAGPRRAGLSGIWVGNGLGMVLLLLFLLAYYAVYEISLPYSNTIIEPLSAVIVALCALGASIGGRGEALAIRRSWPVPALATLLLVLPAAGSVAWQEPAATPGDGYPVRIMTYNVHNGFDTGADLDMEAIAQVIEDSAPDIVALQEVSRGWVINGRVDMLTWLSQRLDMPYISGPTADPFWGNAILSRYPIVEHSTYDLPPRTLFLLRGFTVATVDIGGGERLQVVATHFHHLEEDSDIRQLQAGVVLDFLGDAELTVLLGDLNAEPDAPEMAMLQGAGLVDAMAGVGAAAYTYPSFDPERRIDYIWTSPDLSTGDAHVPLSTASDHLPVVAEIYR